MPEGLKQQRFQTRLARKQLDFPPAGIRPNLLSPCGVRIKQGKSLVVFRVSRLAKGKVHNVLRPFAASILDGHGQPGSTVHEQRLQVPQKEFLGVTLSNQQNGSSNFALHTLLHSCGTAPYAPAMYFAYRLSSLRMPSTLSSRQALLWLSSFFSTSVTCDL